MKTLDESLASRVPQSMLGEHQSIAALRRDIAAAATLQVPVVIEGPTGAGKELVAAELHAAMGSNRRLIALNVAALAESLVDVELFGADRGAYTGASVDRTGLIERAAGGTLFLDEAGDLPLQVQAKMLRTLELGLVRRVGGSADRNIEFRLVVSVQTPTSALVGAGRWREDFFYRVAGLTLRVPALRERLSDVPLLARHFLTQLGRPSLAGAAEGVLLRHTWPGNVRELRRVIERAVFRAGSGMVEVCHIRDAIEPVGIRDIQEAASGRTLREVERRHIETVLREYEHDVAATAQVLGLSERALYRRLSALGIPVRPHQRRALVL
jgi:DNA-binding NtrC family response regulator